MNTPADAEDRHRTPMPPQMPVRLPPIHQMPPPMPTYPMPMHPVPMHPIPARRSPRTERLLGAGKVFLTWLASAAGAYGFKILTASDESRGGFFDSEADHLVLFGILYAVVFAVTAAVVVPVAAGLGDSWKWSPFTIGTVAFFATALIALAIAFRVNLLLGGV